MCVRIAKKVPFIKIFISLLEKVEPSSVNRHPVVSAREVALGSWRITSTLFLCNLAAVQH